MSKFRVTTQLWGHQEEAVSLAYLQPSFLFAMDMGTGKTLAALKLVERLGCRRVLVCMPKSVEAVWNKALQDHGNLWAASNCCNLSIADAATTIQRGGVNFDEVCCFDTINYEKLVDPALQKVLLSVGYDMVIADEAHRIKSHNSKASKFLAKLAKKTGYRLALTGTPWHNKPTDIYGQMRFLDDTVFGANWHNFRTQYEKLRPLKQPGVYQTVGFKNLEELQEKTAPYMYLVKADDVQDLPDVVENVIPVRLSSSASTVYNTLYSDAVVTWRGQVMSTPNVMVKMMRASQIAGGWFCPDDGPEMLIDEEKINVLQDYVSDLDLTVEPVVIFARFTNEVRRIQKAFGDDALILDGEINQLASWQAGDAPILVVQYRAGSEGIDLTRARYVFYYSHEYSLGQYQQSRKRVHRPGQSRRVFIYHLIATGTVDEVVYSALQKKEDVVTSLEQYFSDRENDIVWR